MPEKPETKFKNRLVAKLKSIPRTLVIVKEAGSVHGWPDLIICANGRFVAAELKIPPNTPTPMQLRRMAQIKTARGSCVILTPDKEDDFVELIKAVSERPPVAYKDPQTGETRCPMIDNGVVDK